jgi:hypothetical protein
MGFATIAENARQTKVSDDLGSKVNVAGLWPAFESYEGPKRYGPPLAAPPLVPGSLARHRLGLSTPPGWPRNA